MNSEDRVNADAELSDITNLQELERITIQRVFERVNGDKALAGKMLGISRATLYRKLKRYNIANNRAVPGSALGS